MCEDVEARSPPPAATTCSPCRKVRTGCDCPMVSPSNSFRRNPRAAWARLLAINPRARRHDMTIVENTGTTHAKATNAWPELHRHEGTHSRVRRSHRRSHTLHVDEAYANASHFGCLVAHGLFGLSIADGLKTRSDYRFVPGMSLGWSWDFVLPIKVDDVLHVKLRIAAMRPSKSRPDGRDASFGADQSARRSRAAR